VETLLHNLIPYKYVLHVHPPLINGITCGKSGREWVEKNGGVWVEEDKPGYELALSMLNAQCTMHNGRNLFNIIYLENHGVIYAADTPQEIDRLVENNMAAAAGHRSSDKIHTSYLSPLPSHLTAICRSLYGDTASATFFNDNLIDTYLHDGRIHELSTAITPDHIVYCRHKVLVCEPDKESVISGFKAYRKENGFYPKVVLLKGVGCIALGNSKKEEELAKALFVDAVRVYTYAQNFGGCKDMKKENVDFILGWEAEKYRQSISFNQKNQIKNSPLEGWRVSDGVEKRLNNKVSIITGAAQGFGKGIAELMAGEGAYTIIADLNLEGAVRTAAEINARYGEHTAMPVQVNVTDEDSVKAMVDAVVKEYGGIDILISNAGVLKSGSIEDMDLKTMEFVTKVNYTGYFLCVKYVSEVMKQQHKINPDRFMDIIQINSKSGLAGSNKNFAYAGSKFGGIGLTQSFALELAPYNIKVNAICPGNFFEGPLWSDPKDGLFVQYLRSGKVPGAKTVEDVKKFYEDKVPMGRGCTELDVARAICYIVEQEYETGQAIPVTGGQAMLK
jgi:NAD(P)-dependent dehydrogenase (short-subunit alcohol dehydrogenase family)